MGWHTLEIEGFTVRIGRTARANDELTFRLAGPRDLWLHVAGHAGSHVVVQHLADTIEVPRNVLERAAALAAWHSKARHARGKVEVHVCRVADVRKPPGAPPGTVQLRRFDRIRVYPRDAAAPDERQ